MQKQTSKSVAGTGTFTGWLCILGFLLLTFFAKAEGQSRFNGFGMRYYTVETDHFRINYTNDLLPVAKRVGSIFERLYEIFTNKYGVVLPGKTEVMVTNTEIGNGGTYALVNTILIDVNDLDWDLRGTADWLENVVAHEFAHLISISTSYKTPAWMPYVQWGYFSHPNQKSRVEAIQVVPNEVLPAWFTEGVAQYESSMHGSDSWDSHRDMILRTSVLSNKLLSWDHMGVFSGRSLELEGSYNHGFSLVRYIVQTYGSDKLVNLFRESAKAYHLDFDQSIRAVLGISGRQLYVKWKESLASQYRGQISGIGTQVYGKKINKNGFVNYWPRFSPDGKKIYFVSNGRNDYSFIFNSLYSYSTVDTVPEKKRIKFESGAVQHFYSVNDSSGKIGFTSYKSKKSVLPARQGGVPVSDVFIDQLPQEGKKRDFFDKSTERQVTTRANCMVAAFSPDGASMAVSKRILDRDYLCTVDTNGKNLEILYPPKEDTSRAMRSIYSIDWSKGGQYIAISFIDRHFRKIGLYDRQEHRFSVLFDTTRDCRDPRFSRDGKELYFSSNRNGVFNVYRLMMGDTAIERITNVSGGAFAPDPSADCKKLVFASYDSAGYGIYLMDSIRVLERIIPGEGKIWVDQSEQRESGARVAFGNPRPYSHFPRQVLFIPTIMIQQVVTENNNPFVGRSSVQYGGIFNVNDPFDWEGHGTSLGAYLLASTLNPFNFFSGTGIIDRKIGYDAGLFGSTSLLPVDISCQFLARAIPDQSEYLVDATGIESMQTLQLSHALKGMQFSIGHSPDENIFTSGYASYDSYKQWVEIRPTYISLDIARSMHFGFSATFLSREINSRMHIEPRGLAAKLKYEFWNADLIPDDAESRFTIKDGMFLTTNFDNYRYHLLSGTLLYGKAAPWYSRHTINLRAQMTGIALTKDCLAELRQKQIESANPYLHHTVVPQYYRPMVQLHGYASYFKDTSVIYLDSAGKVTDTLKFPTDTSLLSGHGVVQAHLSYLFPLFPGSIDRQVWFFYFDRIYGGVNFGGAAALMQPKDFVKLTRNDILTYTGFEIRLDSKVFYSFPLAVTARWDWGLDRNPPIGGQRFSLQMGFSFNDWILVQD